MKRVVIALCLMLWATVDAVAGPVTAEAARQQAIQFFAQRGRAMTSADGLHLARRHAPVSGNIQAGAAYYVFNADKGGFVIVAGDDRAPAILGYSDQGRFDDATLPENMQAWLQGYADQMEWLENHPEATARQGVATPAKQAIAPMLTTEWNQAVPYNDMCPIYDEQRCVTGCLATAMAQIVAYHGKRTGQPTTISQNIPSYETTDNNYKFTVDLVQADTTTFVWAKMLDVYSSGYTLEERYAVARLMACCGKSTRENYRPTSTSGWLDRVPAALTTYFGYDAGVRWIERENNYTLRQWNDLVYSELVANRPVLLGGQSSGGGHAFVLDGYDGNELFHVNWGWGGNSNGYFLLSILNPDDNSGIGASSTTDGYSFGQEILIGAQPAGLGGGLPVVEEVQMTWSDMSISGTDITLTFTNKTGATRSFDYGLAWVESDGSLSLIGDAQQAGDLANDGGFAPTLHVPATHAAGTYKVVPVSRVSGTGTWFAAKNTSIFYVEAVYPDNSSAPTLTLHPNYGLTCDAVSFPGSKFADELQPVEVELTNTGDEFHGVLYLFASQTKEKGTKYVARTGITLQRGKSDTFGLEFTPAAAGTWNVWVTTDAAGSNVLKGPVTVDVTTASRPYVSNIMFAALELPDANPASWTTVDGHPTVDVYAKEVIVNLSVQNVSGADMNNVLVFFYLHYYDEENSSWVQVGRRYLSSPWATLKARQVKNFSQMSLGQNLVAGKTYRLSLFYSLNDGEEIEADTRYRIHIAEGFPVWDRQGNKSYVNATNGSAVTIGDDVLCADLYQFDCSGGITPNANPNTLYLLGSTQGVPKGLTGKNVVQGTTAASIALTDDGTNGFFTPIDFTATAISYTRTFDKGYTSDGKNWSTIMLPFAATSCSARVNASDIPVDWYHNGSQTGKNFWVMAFAGEEGATVSYSHAATMQANMPYLIAVPGPDFGNRWDMQDLPVTFSATDAAIRATSSGATTGTSRKFVGTLVTTPSLSDIYVLNSDGNLFTQQTTTVAPFRAYFTTPSISTPYTTLDIRFMGTVSGIDGVKEGCGETTGGRMYDLQGRCIESPRPTKGIYISGGKKIIR